MWRQRAEVEQRPYQRVNIGIGLNTGPCCVGNLGSTYRFDYSAIGDDVNLTSRFEGLTKHYGLPAILGERSLAPGFHAFELDAVAVKGRTRSTKIYTLVDLLGAEKSQFDRLIQKYGTFLTAYRNQEWDAAKHLINECREIGVSQLDTCYSLFALRIDLLRKTSLPPNWDGSFAMTEK